MTLRLRFPGTPRLSALIWATALIWAVTLAPPGASTAQAQSREALQRIADVRYGHEAVERGRAYQRPRLLLYLVQTVVVLGIAWLLALGPLGRWEASLRGLFGGSVLLTRAAAITGLSLGTSLLGLPFALIRFYHARAHGMRHDTLLSFFADWGKALGVEVVIWLAVGLVVLGAFAAWPRVWWLVSWGGIAVLTALYVHLAPIVVDPLFNKITPLADPVLAERVLDVARRGGVNADQVLVADASRRSRAANAYFTGLLGSRRIVLYDTLLDRFDEAAVLSVVAHEVGHWKRQHVNRGLFLGLLAAGGGLFLAHLLLGAWVRTGWHGLAGRDAALLVLPGFALYLTLSLIALVPSNAISRRWEADADRTSLELTQDPESFIRSQVQLNLENLSDPLPPRWLEVMLYTHPAGARRIYMAETWR